MKTENKSGGDISFKTLFCFLLFAAPFVEFIIPGGDVYLASVAGICAFAGVLLEIRHRKSAFTVSSVDILFWICWGYAVARMPFPVDISLCMKFVAVSGIWCYGRLNATPEFRCTVVWWMVASGVGQSVVGLLQGLGVWDSFHSEFVMTGTFGNPGPFGGYLAVTAALLFPYVLRERQPFAMRSFLFVCFMVVALALVLSDSRAAWCAVCVSVVLFLYLKHPFENRIVKVGCAVSLAVGIPVAVLFLYNYRPASADARMLIWRVCGEVIAQSPVTGAGTGRFAACYMPAQAEYLMTATEGVRYCADDNQFAYNETLAVLCELGVVGLLWVAVFLGCVMRGLKVSFNSDGEAVFLFPVVALLVFSQFSYPLNIWSFVVFFTLMSAIGLGRGQAQRWRISVSCRRLLFIICPCACGLLLVVSLALRWRAQAWIDGYAVFATSSHCPDRVTDWCIRHDPFLLACCADAAFLRADYPMALGYMACLDAYARAARWCIRQGKCHEEMGDSLKALECYRAASRMVPGLMYPVFAEFNLCRKEGKREEASCLARKIMGFRPKIENRKTRLMRKEVSSYLHGEGE